MYTEEITKICDEIIKTKNKTLSKQYSKIINEITSTFPAKIRLASRIIAIANNFDIRSLLKYEAMQKAIKIGEEQFKNSIENDDYLICKICGCKTANVINHIRIHDIKLNDYKVKYNVNQVKTNKQIELMKGENNPGFNHGGRLSVYSDKFIHADKVDKKEVVKKLIKTRTENGNNTTSIDYWLKQTNGDVELANKLLSERQSTFSIEKCIEKYGEVKGKNRWSERQEKWLKNNKKNNYSKISQKLFDLIMTRYISD